MPFQTPVTADVTCHHCAVLQVFQQELDSRQSMVAAMRSSPTSDPAVATQLDELTSVWDRVNQLCQVREARLQEALKLVSHFFNPSDPSQLNSLVLLSPGCSHRCHQIRGACKGIAIFEGPQMMNFNHENLFFLNPDPCQNYPGFIAEIPKNQWELVSYVSARWGHH